MAKYHPCDNTLIEFAAGNLDWALAICVSAHLEFCPECRNKLAGLNQLGGFILENAAVRVSVETPEKAQTQQNDNFARLMTKIREAESAPAQNADTDSADVRPLPTEQRGKNLPRVVRKLLPKDKPLKWKFVSPALREAQLVTGQDKYQVSLHRIKRGGQVAGHDHGGLEVTLVLEGSFSDEQGSYSLGDYLVKEPGTAHRPMAALHQDCLCLSVVAAPVRLSGLLGRIINPFLKIHPA